MNQLAASMLLVVACFSVHAQDSELEKTDQERAEDVCNKKPDIDLQSCIDETVKKWNDPAYKTELKRAEIFGHTVFKKCQSTDNDQFERCAKKEYLRFSPGKSYDLSDYMAAHARLENWGALGSLEEKRKNKVLSQCARMHVKQGTVRLGMTADMIKECGWGEPEDVNRTVYRDLITEQWVYGNGQYLYLRNGVLDSIQD